MKCSYMSYLEEDASDAAAQSVTDGEAAPASNPRSAAAFVFSAWRQSSRSPERALRPGVAIVVRGFDSVALLHVQNHIPVQASERRCGQ